MTLILNGTTGLSDVDGSAATPAVRGTDANTGIFFPAADTIAFAEGGVEAMRIDSSGNVGISGSGGSSTNRLSFTYNGGTGEATVGPNSTGGSTFLTLGTSNAGTYAERARIDASGNLLVGTASGPSHVLLKNNSGQYGTFITNTSANPYGLQLNFTDAAPNSSLNQYLLMVDTGGNRAYFNSNGGLANYQANNVNLSDERKKKDIELAGSYLDKICAIPVKTFLYKDQTDTEINLGVIAQDVEAVAPELIDHDGWLDKPPEGEQPYKSIYQTDLQYALMKCIQELKAQNDELKARVDALENPTVNAIP
jgi:hypothetical protein